MLLPLVCGIALAEEPAAAPPAPAVISADLISAESGIVTGAGSVRVEMGDQRAEGLRFVLDLASATLVLEEGSWLRSEGTLSFSRATIALGDLSGVLLDARYTGESFIASGETLTFVGEELAGSAVTVTVCGCPEGSPQTWDVTARTVSVTLDEVARFSGGWIRVCERRVLPVPAGLVVLSPRRTGFLPPVLGYGVDGLQLAAPFFLAASEHADLTLTPEWRAERGIRGLSRARLSLAEGEGSELRGALGRDTAEDAWRGAVDLEHAWTPGPLRTGIDAQRWSDLDYQADYGGDFLTRAAPWTESVGVIGIPGLRAESDTFQYTRDTTQRPISGVLWGTTGRGAVSAWGQGRADVFAEGADPAALSAAALRGSAAGGLSASQRWTALHLTATGSGRGVAWEERTPWLLGGAEVTAMVPMWGDVGGLRHLAAAGIVASAARWSADAVALAPDEALPDSIAVGPRLTSRWVSPGGVPISAVASLPWTPDGLRPMLSARLQHDGWSGRLQATDTLQAASVGWSDEPGGISLSAVRSGDITQGGLSTSWWLPGVPILLGWRHLASIQQTLSAGPTLGYRSPCDCLDVRASASWSADRGLPDLGLQLRIR
jgi:hypothetical protein